MATRAGTARVSREPQSEVKDFEAKVQKRLAELEIQQDIIALREDLGLTQSQLAELAGVSQPFIAKLESGRATNIELKTLVRAATALGAYVEIRIRKNPGPSHKSGGRREEARKKSETLSATAGRR